MGKINKSDIESVLEKYLTVCDSAANKRNAGFWTNAGKPWLNERWRGISAKKTGAPFTMALDIAGYSTVLGINCLDYYGNADVQLYEQMRYHLWEAEHLRCNRFFDKKAFVSFQSAMEANAFGAKITFLPTQSPWVDFKNPAIKERSDLDKLRDTDISKAGLIVRAHEFYERMCELVEGSGISVMYPVMQRGPFPIATELRGTNELLMDLVDAPDFVHELMRWITDGLKEHARRRADYVGEPIAPCKLGNDEIATPMIAPSMYEEFILPYELELADFHGSVMYWHSCGITDPFYELIGTIPNLEMMHIGPWSNVGKAAEVFGKLDIALDICINSTEDIYDRTPEEMRRKLLKIKDACEGKVRYAVRADGFQIIRTIEKDLAK
ncbi:MAG: hypothetical protein JW852_11990, partial [Spirochaetales bacterium]|nr:hypothetical protein [Spirochaetales bacterium]